MRCRQLERRTVRWIEASMTTAHRTPRTPNPAASVGLIRHGAITRSTKRAALTVVDGAADYRCTGHLESEDPPPTRFAHTELGAFARPRRVKGAPRSGWCGWSRWGRIQAATSVHSNRIPPALSAVTPREAFRRAPRVGTSVRWRRPPLYSSPRPLGRAVFPCS